ncbi:hypothetical protein [Aminobacter sp. MDW-2]|uniref:hypothetical protein n=1 Tax=Aminobacter sp. MDW-2 TaxID=2666139 RepID=UPI00163B71F6|nr:hypothetical protein [Aminobacter sp. MDW-2]QNH34564.1 hypothetical protein H5P29_01005 [Aminobacter sp. MDW-2]
MTETPAAEDDGFEWAMVEIFGHRCHAGRAREEERFGAKMLRIDVPAVEWKEIDGEFQRVATKWVSRFYGGASIFSFTLTDEETVLRANRPYSPPNRLLAPPAETFTETDHNSEEQTNDREH